MTKYNKEALDAAEDAVSFSHSLTNRGIATAVFDSLERAPWWEEIKPGYEFRAGEPYREESPVRGEHGERVYEGLADRPFTLQPVVEGPRTRFFIDTRWQPPVKPLEIGDLIETEEQAASLPIGTIAVTETNEAFRKAGMNEWRRANAERGLLLSDFEMADDGDRVICLPSGDSNE